MKKESFFLEFQKKISEICTIGNLTNYQDPT